VKLWKEKFPPNSYIMRGVGIANLMDVTLDRSLASITSNLLTKTQESFVRILNNMRNLFGVPDLDAGFMEFENDTFIKGHKKDMGSFLLDGMEKLDCKGNMCDRSFHYLIQSKEPMVIPDVEKFDELSNSTFSNLLNKRNLGSYIIAPLINNDELLGFMEIGSKEKFVLNGSSLTQLQQVMPIFSMAIARFKREGQNMREAIIQQECTTIHDAVKWRFDEEADKFMAAQYKNEQPVFSDIVFKDVYPLYGQLDIKGSSEKRNEAIKGDLLKQIKGIRKVLSGALKKTGMPVYDQLMFRLDEHRDEIRSGMSSGTEQKIQSFLVGVINPVFEQLRKENGEMAKLVNKYREMLNTEMGTVYELRKKFDTSVNVINQTLASMLDEKQIEAQKMFPHYFERYKTDGVEYNMYIGQSISGNRDFDPVFLNNLRIWQLISTCELEKRFEELKKEIETPLEIASLILV